MRAAGLVSILIVTYDHADEIDACLDGALRQAAEGLDIEIVVADNASHDATVARVRGGRARTRGSGSSRWVRTPASPRPSTPPMPSPRASTC